MSSPNDVKPQIGLIGTNNCLDDPSSPSKLKLPDIGVLIDNQNIIKWTVDMEKLEEKELVLKYSVEYPQNETIEYIED